MIDDEQNRTNFDIEKFPSEMADPVDVQIASMLTPSLMTDAIEARLLRGTGA